MTQHRMNRQVVLKTRPTGALSGDHFDIIEQPLPGLHDGEFLVRNIYCALEPGLVGAMRGGKYVIPPIPLGGVVPGATAGVVEASRHRDFREGDDVAGFGGWQAYTVFKPDPARLRLTDPHRIDTGVAPLTAHLGVLGLSGFTGFVGTFAIANLQAGETFAVSAAAGAVGAAAGQFAKLSGARVVGITGGPKKCAHLTETLGFDAALDRNADDLGAALDRACPDGIDVHFENVGGAVLDAVLPRMNRHGRVALCGMIAQYNEANPPPGPNLMMAVISRLTIRGFVATDFPGVEAEFIKKTRAWYRDGKLKDKHEIITGLDELPAAYLGVLKGENFGKRLVRVD